MKTLFSMNDRIEGIMSIFYVFGNRWEFVRKSKNMILYSGADIMAKAIVGTPKMRIGGMYMEYSNEVPAISAAPAVTRDRLPADYEALTTPYGYSRVPLTAAPGFAPGDVEYQGNIVTVQAQTNGSSEAGEPLTDNVSYVYAAALVAMPEPDDKAQDILFSAANIYEPDLVTLAPVPKIANAQIGIKWDLKFT